MQAARARGVSHGAKMDASALPENARGAHAARAALSPESGF
jgi:hypothetical protein